MKLLGRETGESVMLFEETLPAGTTSLRHLHHDSDEVARVLAGEFTFKIGDEITVGLAPAHSCRATCRMLGGTPAANSAVFCFSTLRSPRASSLRRCLSATHWADESTGFLLPTTVGARSFARVREFGSGCVHSPPAHGPDHHCAGYRRVTA